MFLLEAVSTINSKESLLLLGAPGALSNRSSMRVSNTNKGLKVFKKVVIVKNEKWKLNIHGLYNASLIKIQIISNDFVLICVNHYSDKTDY